MIIYVLGFLIMYILIRNNAKNKKINKLLIFIGLFLPCLIAALRNQKIGTDIKVYLSPLYDATKDFNMFYLFAKGTFFNEYYNTTLNVSSYDFGFTFLIYMVAKTINNFQVLLFFIEAIIILPLYFGAKELYKDNKKIAMFMLIYALVFYSIGLNAMRQIMSLSLFFYGFCYYISKGKNYKIKLLLSCILAYLFHKTALLYIPIIAIYKLLEDCNNKEIVYEQHRIPLNKIFLFIVIAVIALLIINFNMLGELLINIGLSHYGYYIKGESLGISGLLIFKIPFYIMITFLLKFGLKSGKKLNNYFIIIILAIEIFTTLLYHVNIYAMRIGYVFQLLLLLFICDSFSNIFSNIFRNKNKNKFIICACYLYFFAYWYYYTVVSQLNQTVPYLFFFQ